MKKNKKKLIENDLVFTKHKIDSDTEKDDVKSEKNNSVEIKKEENLDNVDNVLNKENISSRFSEEEIEENLREIYSDDGNLPDFKTIKIKRRKSFWTSLFYFLLIFLLVGLTSYWVFNYVKNTRDISSVLELNINAPSKVALGEEFIYEIEYRNSSNYTLNNINLEFLYPDNFILSDIYSVDESNDNRVWKISSLGPKLNGKIKIRGKIINKEGLNNLLSVKANYEISGLSSSFSRDSFSSVSIGSLPFQVYDDLFSTVLIGEEYPMKLDFKNFPFDKINNFIISFSGPDDIFFIKNIENKNIDSEKIVIEKIDENNFRVKSLIPEILLEDLSLDFRYKISEKNNDQEVFSWSLKYVDDVNKEFVFFEKQLRLDVIKSDLHLNILINESSVDFPVNFGDKLDYVIKYSNKGDKNMKDLVIMAVLDSDFLNWSSLSDLNKGGVSRKTISWTFREVPELKELKPGQGGEIKFSINVSDFKKVDFGQKLEIKSYSQFSIGNIDDFQEEGERLSDNRSNIIIKPINSNLSFKEEVLYFNDDNIPVGSGPLPPVVGEKTSFKYYWTLQNTLHELRDIKVELLLPAYVIWENDYNVGAGGVSFDPLNNKVIWTLSRWPLGIDKIIIDFNVSVIPTDNEYNKIIILSSGALLEASDIETGAIIIKKTGVKTSKLEDDVIAGFSNDGRVR